MLYKRWYCDSFLRAIRTILTPRVEGDCKSIEDADNVMKHILSRLFEFLYISVYRETTFNEIFNNADPDVFLEMHNGVIDQRITLVQGGSTRQESVYHGLVKVKNSYVMIHDGARPFLNQDLLDSIKNTLTTEDACLLMVPCKDTIKKVIDGYVETTYDRSTLMAAQTPQAFKTDLILSCTKKAMEENYTGTDDASLVEKYSDVKVKAVEGSYANIKITTIEDLKG